MPSPDNREKRHRVQDEQEGTGDPEEIPHHQVRGPGGLQFRQAVEYIEGIPALLLDHPVDFHREGFKPVGKRNADPLHFRAFRHQFRVAGKAEIDNPPPVLLCLFHKGIRKAPEFIQVGDAPYDIVPHPDIIHRPVKSRDTGEYFVKSRHAVRPLPDQKEAKESFRTPLPLTGSIPCTSPDVQINLTAFLLVRERSVCYDFSVRTG